jgi:predicted DCC family thiol-disulfide oxidoreductase YuxK
MINFYYIFIRIEAKDNSKIISNAMSSMPPLISHPHASDANSADSQSPTWQIKLLYDGACPLCLREVNFLTRRDAGRGRVIFVDIADPNYQPEANGGIDFETAMGRIHAVLPDGTVLKNVEVFRRIYEILDIGWVYAITKLPLVGTIADQLYGFWADRRLWLTRRPDLATLAAARQSSIISAHPTAESCNSTDRCRL